MSKEPRTLEWEVEAERPPAKAGQLIRFDHIDGPILARVVDVTRTETGYLMRLEEAGDTTAECDSTEPT